MDTGLRSGIRNCRAISSRLRGVAKEEEEVTKAKGKTEETKTKKMKKILGGLFYPPLFIFIEDKKVVWLAFY